MKLDTYKTRLAMAEAEMNIYKLADAMGISYGRVSHYLRTGTAQTDIIGKIAHAIGVPVEQITAKEEEE